MPRRKLHHVVDGRDNTKETDRPYTHVLVGPKMYFGRDVKDEQTGLWVPSEVRYEGYRHVVSWHLSGDAAMKKCNAHNHGDGMDARYAKRCLAAGAPGWSVERVAADADQGPKVSASFQAEMDRLNPAPGAK